MTVSTEVARRVEYTGNDSTTVFAYSFPIFADADIVATLVTDSTGVGATQTITTHYTVSGAGGSSGGNVTMIIAPATGETLVIESDLDVKQTVDLVDNDSFAAATMEGALDRLTLQTQEIKDDIARSITLPTTATGSVSTVLPNPTASRLIGWDAAATALENASTFGSWQGNWVTATVYDTRDIVKDSSNDNIYIVLSSYTSGANVAADVSNGDIELVIDAAAAATSAAAAAADAVSTAADVVTTNADVVLTNADVVSTGNDVTSTNADVVLTNADVVTTNADAASTTADVSTTGASAAAAAASAALVPLHKFDATTAPTANEDSGDGYGVGSHWVDVTADKTYVLVDATVASAVWNQVDSTFDAASPGAIGGTTPGSFNGTTGVLSGILSVDDTTDSTSGTTGSIHTDGGLGVAKDIFCAGDINALAIRFNGDTAAANSLDDYEEGLYNPTIVGASSGNYVIGGGATTFAYTKVGRVVHVQGFIQAASDNAISGQLRLSLPTTTAALTEIAEAGMSMVFSESHGDAGIENMYLRWSGGVAYAGIYNVTDTGTEELIDEARMDASFNLVVSFTYISA